MKSFLKCLISGSLRLFAIPHRKKRLTIRTIGSVSRRVGPPESFTTAPLRKALIEQAGYLTDLLTDRAVNYVRSAAGAPLYAGADESTSGGWLRFADGTVLSVEEKPARPRSEYGESVVLEPAFCDQSRKTFPGRLAFVIELMTSGLSFSNSSPKCSPSVVRTSATCPVRRRRR